MSITEEKARKYATDPDHHAEYVRLGGELELAAYVMVATQFYMLTFDAYIGGEGSSAKSWARFVGGLAVRHPDEDASNIFRSVDNVHAYT